VSEAAISVKTGMQLDPKLLDDLQMPVLQNIPDLVNVNVWKLKAVVGQPDLFPLEDDEVEVALDWPEGVAGAAERHLGNGDTQQAVRLLAQEMEAPTPDWVAAKVHCLVSNGELHEAQHYLQNLGDDEKYGLARAILAMQNQDMLTVSEGLDCSRESSQNLVTWQYFNGLRFVVQGRAHQAGGIFGRIVRNAPEHGLALFRLGWLAKNMGDTARSGILLEQVLERSPKILEAGITLTELFLESNMPNDALAVLERVGGTSPAALTPWVLRVRILMAVGNTSMAAEIAEQLKQQRPDDPDILMLYAECEQAAGRPDAAKAQLLQMVDRVEFSQKELAYQLLGQICQNQGGQQNLEQAANFYEEAANHGELQPKNRFQVAQIKWQLGRLQEAENHFSKIDESADINVLLAAATWGHQRNMAHAKILARWAKMTTMNTNLGEQVAQILANAGL